MHRLGLGRLNTISLVQEIHYIHFNDLTKHTQFEL